MACGSTDFEFALSLLRKRYWWALRIPTIICLSVCLSVCRDLALILGVGAVRGKVIRNLKDDTWSKIVQAFLLVGSSFSTFARMPCRVSGFVGEYELIGLSYLLHTWLSRQYDSTLVMV